MDDDQALMWYACAELLRGRWHEPGFFGQAYNSVIEALLAVVPVKLGASYAVALPAVTSVLALAPFVLLGWVALRRGSTLAAVAIAALPLVLTLDYAAVTSLPRGFVPGVFFASLAACIVARGPESRWDWFWIGALSTFSAGVLANALLVVVPVVAYVLLALRERLQVCPLVLGLVAGALPPMLSWIFYWRHPDYVLHRIPLGLSAEGLVTGLAGLDARVGQVSPLGLGWVTLLGLALAAVLLFRRGRRAESALPALALALVLGSFVVSYAHYGVPEVGLPLSRFYLGLPVVIALTFCFLIDSADRRAAAVVVVAAVVATIVRSGWIEARFAAFTPPENRVVAFIPVSEVVDAAAAIRREAPAHEATLVVFPEGYGKRALAYGCGALLDGEVDTLLAGYERRTWRLREEASQRRSRFFLYGIQAFSGSDPLLKGRIVCERPYLLLLESPPLPPLDVLSVLGIGVREFKR